MIRPERANLYNNVEQYIHDRTIWMADAMEVVCGDRTRDPLKEFPEPGQVRHGDLGLELTPKQEADLREKAGRFGLGGEADVPSGADIQINEGGKVWKVQAEAEITAGATQIIFAGSPNRIIGSDEEEHMTKRMGWKVKPGETTEYAMIRQVAISQTGFEALEAEEVLPYGYDTERRMVKEPTGQLVRVGHIKGVPVLILRVDKVRYPDEETPKNANGEVLLGFMSRMLSDQGDSVSSLGFNTSTTYVSREIDTIQAGLRHNRSFAVGMYGRKTLSDIRNVKLNPQDDLPEIPEAEPTEINQIPGELHQIWKKLLILQAHLSDLREPHPFDPSGDTDDYQDEQQEPPANPDGYENDSFDPGAPGF